MSAEVTPEPISDSKLLKMALDARREEYKDLSELWRHLDTKAQSTVPLVGILMAAFVGFVTKKGGPVCVADRVLSVGEVLLLTATAVLFVVSLTLRESIGAPFLGVLQSMIDDVLKLSPDERAKRMDDLAREELDAWEKCNDSVRLVTEKKSKWLYRGQISICVAILWLAVFAVIQVLE